MISRRSVCSIPLRALLNTLFPPICLHCEELTEGEVLCQSCSELLTPLHPQDRCYRCFEEKPCKGCQDSPFARAAGVFAHYGPARTLIRELPGSPYLAKGCAGYVALQMEALGYPSPDMVVSAPGEKGALGKAVGRLIEVPFVRALGRVGREGARLRREVEGKTVLLVSGVWDERSGAWGDALQEGLPERVYGMGICFSKNESSVMQ